MRNLQLKAAVLGTAACFSCAAFAADLRLTESTSASYEYLNLVEHLETQPLRVELADSYTKGDFLIFEFPGAAVVDVSSLPTQLHVEGAQEYDLRTMNSAFNVGELQDSPCDDAIAAYPELSHWHYESQTTYPYLDTDELCQGYVSEGTHLLREFAAPDLLAAYKGVTLDQIGSGYTAATDVTWVKYRLTSVHGEGAVTTVGTPLNFGAVRLKTEALRAVASPYRVTTLSRMNYDTYPSIDGATADPLDVHDHDQATLLTLQNQWQLKTTRSFARTVGVEDPYRRLFVVAAGYADQRVDVAEYQLTSPSLTLLAEPRHVTYTLAGAGRFTWLQDQNTALEGLQPGSQVELASDDCSLTSVSDAALVWRCDAGAAAEDLLAQQSITLRLNGEEIIQHGAFSLTAEVGYGTTETTLVQQSTLAAQALGEWQLNATEWTLSALPFATQLHSGQVVGIDQVLYLTNQKQFAANEQAPRIHFAVTESTGQVHHLTDTVLDDLRAETGITKLAGPLREALFAAGLLDHDQRLVLTVTVEQTAAQLSLHSSYNAHGTDRAWLPNNSNRVAL